MIVYLPGTENGRADALSLNTVTTETQVSQVCTAQSSSRFADISQLLEAPPLETDARDFIGEQRKDQTLLRIIRRWSFA